MSEFKAKISELTARKKQLSRRINQSPPELVSGLERLLSLELTLTSNRLEGNSLTREEVQQIVERDLGVSNKKISEILEIRNHHGALKLLGSLAHKPLTSLSSKDILDLQNELFFGIQDLEVIRSRTITFDTPEALVIMPNILKILSEIDDFIYWLRKSNQNTIELAIEAHFNFIKIRPFTYGNSKTARLIFNLILQMQGFPLSFITLEEKNRYLESLEKAKTYNSSKDYYELMLASVERSLAIAERILSEESAPQPVKQKVQIGKLAKLSGEKVSTLRYWQDQGLLAADSVTGSGYHLFSTDNIQTIKLIRQLQEDSRLSLSEIKKQLSRNL
jgi:Fic family protein